MDRIPILIYHGFYKKEDEVSGVAFSHRRYFLSVVKFTEHVQRLTDLNYSICSIEKVSGPNAVVFTFDDGHLSNYTWAWPMLADRGFSGTFFIVADRIGRPGHIDGSQLREMSSGGMSIGSHGLTHRPLAGLAEAALDRELGVSKDRLEQVLGKAVTTLSLPHGLLDRRVMERARAAGYKRICTSRAGLMGPGFVVPRLSVTNSTSIEAIAGYASRDPFLIGRARALQAARLAVKRLIGVRGYEALCRAVLGAQ